MELSSPKPEKKKFFLFFQNILSPHFGMTADQVAKYKNLPYSGMAAVKVENNAG